MQPADVNEDRCNETPPLALRNRGIGLDAERHKRLFIRASARKRHKKKDSDIQTEEYIGIRRAAGPDGMKKFEVIFGNHFSGAENGNSGDKGAHPLSPLISI